MGRIEQSPETAALRSVQSAMRAIAKTDTHTVEVRQVANSTDFQALLNDLSNVARPFALWVVTQRHADDRAFDEQTPDEP